MIWTSNKRNPKIIGATGATGEKIAIMDELPINWTYPEIQMA